MSIRKGVAALLLALTFTSAHAEKPLWTQSAQRINQVQDPAMANRWFVDYKIFDLDLDGMRDALNTAPAQTSSFAKATGLVMRLPVADGRLQEFRVIKAPIFTPEVGAQMPGVMTYEAFGVTDKNAYARLDIGPNGFHGMILSPSGTVIIDPVSRFNKSQYLVFDRSKSYSSSSWNCYPGDAPNRLFNRQSTGGPVNTPNVSFRLVMHGTGEYTAFWGSEFNALAAITTTTNRVAGVYQIDFGIQLILVHGHSFANAASDPFTGDDVFAMLAENQAACDSEVGSANYDVGHVMSTGNGGVASLGVVGKTGTKARGATGWDSPSGDAFDIDFVAHEIGHQFGANHTFNNGSNGSCGGGNRSAGSAYEPGGGTTIMAYAGICGAADIQPHSDPYFHIKSILVILALRDNPAAGGISTFTTNQFPVAGAGSDYSIPRGTPFMLNGSATDPDGPVTTSWEQYDLGNAEPTTNNATRPLFRVFNPTNETYRVLPRMADLVSGAAHPWETLPTVDRTMTWRMVVRDMDAPGAATAWDEMVVTVSGAPFLVTSQNINGIFWTPGSVQTVTWDQGGTLAYSPKVTIYLSYDGGASFATGSATVVEEETDNDGEAAIIVPQTLGSDVRVVVASANTIFFNLAQKNVEVVTPVALDLSIAPTSVVGGESTTAAITLESEAPIGGVPVTISDDGPELSTPDSVNVPEGSLNAYFLVATTPVASTVTRSVTATRGVATDTVSIAITPGALSSFTLSPTAVYGGSNTTGTATLNGPAVAAHNTVNLSDNTSAITTPNSMTVTPGQVSGTVTIATTSVGSAATRQVTAQFAGITKIASLTIHPKPQISTFTLSPTTVFGGSSTTGTVTLSAPAAAGPIGVVLSDNTSAITTPPSLSISSGNSGTVSLPTTNVASTVTRQVYAQLNSVTKTANLTINPAIVLMSFTVSPTTVSGGSNTTGTVTINQNAPAGGTTIALSDNTSALTTPASTLVAAGTSSRTFSIAASQVAASVTRQAYASFASVTKTVNITILPGHNLVSLAMNPTSVQGGVSSTGTVTMSSNAPVGGTVVALSDNTSVIVVPANVTVPAGAATQSFTAKTSPVSATATRQVTATHNGVTRTANLTLTP